MRLVYLGGCTEYPYYLVSEVKIVRSKKWIDEEEKAHR
jgi:hypothetical protein